MLHHPLHTQGLEPAITLALSAPPKLSTDEEIAGTLSVHNDGAVSIATGTVLLGVPEELVFRGADGRGALNDRGDAVQWTFGPLPPGATWQAQFRFAGFSPGQLELVAHLQVPGCLERTSTVPLTCEVRQGRGATLAELLAGLSYESSGESFAIQTIAPRETRERFLLFRASGARFALPLASVEEVLRPLPVTRVPGGPTWLLGVANVRGDIATVVEFASFMRLTAAGQRRGLVLVRSEGHDRLGILIDDVLGIQPLAADHRTGGLDPADPLTPYLSGITLDAAGVIHRLNPHQLLSAIESGSGLTA
jgi:chemotaxis signal transduction protein